VSSIHGIGVDLVEIQRMEGALERQGDTFLRRILNEDELSVYQQRFVSSPERGLRYLATRFAAKEAFSKAMGTGIGSVVGFHLLSILNDEKGRPYIVLRGSLKVMCEEMALQIFVSLSDEVHYATAQVLISKIN
jgi:holo-[acyl-carrier-protein] synthase